MCLLYGETKLSMLIMVMLKYNLRFYSNFVRRPWECRYASWYVHPTATTSSLSSSTPGTTISEDAAWWKLRLRPSTSSTVPTWSDISSTPWTETARGWLTCTGAWRRMDGLRFHLRSAIWELIIDYLILFIYFFIILLLLVMIIF